MKIPRSRITASYASAGIPEYWIVYPQDGFTEVYRDPDPVRGLYANRTTIPAGAPLLSTAVPGFAFLLTEALEA